MVKIMRFEDNHLSDEDLLLAADGELSARDSARVHLHLAACWTCRARKQEIESAVGEFVRAYRQTFDSQCPSGDGPRALLKSQMSLLAEARPESRVHYWFRHLSWRFSGAILAIAGLAAVAAYLTSPSWFGPQRVRAATVMVPNPQLTPGATVFMTREQVCRAGNDKNAVVSADVRRKVFAAYGISSGAPRDYEVDYLITPALGGADDIRNLWPESYGAVVWNARVKDALEDRMRELVCTGQLDLATAQREIAMDWIGSYKKYFHTERPLATEARNR
jgi:hypothetical protein